MKLTACAGISFWAGKETAVRGKNLVAWPTVCCPTSCGGLGVANLRLSGFALRVRWLWMQRTEEQRAWSALPIKIEPEVQALFDASVVVHVGNGERTLFWPRQLDQWFLCCPYGTPPLSSNSQTDR